MQTIEALQLGGSGNLYDNERFGSKTENWFTLVAVIKQQQLLYRL